MYDPSLLPPAALDWVMGQAQNELNAFLCEEGPDGKKFGDWAEMVDATAAQCRIVAASATSPVARESWLTLAQEYEAAKQR